MAESNRFSKSPNFQIELAKERNRIAADRTLLSWIRTSVSLIGIGFAVERIVTKLYLGSKTDQVAPIILVKVFSLLFVGIGTLAVILAALDYQGEIKRLQQPEYDYTPRSSLSIKVAGALVIIAISAFLTIWRQATS
ncbi:MAG: DUF202 domain-containing protein [Waterburya sp.]